MKGTFKVLADFCWVAKEKTVEWYSKSGVWKLQCFQFERWLKKVEKHCHTCKRVQPQNCNGISTVQRHLQYYKSQQLAEKKSHSVVRIMANKFWKAHPLDFVSALFMWVLRRDQRKSSFTLVDITLWGFKIMKWPFEIRKKSLVRPSKTKNNLDKSLLAS